MGYFQVRYDSRVVIFEHKMFIGLATGDPNKVGGVNRGLFHKTVFPICVKSLPLLQIRNLQICKVLRNWPQMAVIDFFCAHVIFELFERASRTLDSGKLNFNFKKKILSKIFDKKWSPLVRNRFVPKHHEQSLWPTTIFVFGLPNSIQCSMTCYITGSSCSFFGHFKENCLTLSHCSNNLVPLKGLPSLISKFGAKEWPKISFWLYSWIFYVGHCTANQLNLVVVVVTSVTRFGKILPLWQNIKSLRQFFEDSLIVGKIFNPLW